MTLRSSRHFATFLSICLMEICLSFPHLMAQQISLSPSAPPAPASAQIQCYKGESVTVVFRSSTRSIQQLKFILRKSPHLGHLSELQIVDRTTAVAEYTHDPQKGVGLDEITYAIQGPDTPVSAPSKIEIAVQNPPAILESPDILNFPATPIGESATLSLPIKNPGGSPLILTLQSEPPFIMEEAVPMIPPGGEYTLKILFKPDAARQYAQRISFQGAPNPSFLQLTGEGTAPFAFKEHETTLAFEPSSDARQATMHLVNHTAHPLDIELVAPDSLLFPKTLTLPANKEIDIPVSVRPLHKEGVDSVLEARTSAYSAEIKIKALPAPPFVVSESGDTIDFGNLQRGRLYRQGIRLKNEGGSSARLGVRLPEGVHVLPEPESMTIAPGQSESFEILYEPKTDHIDPQTLLFTFGARNLPINLIGTLEQGATKQEPVPQKPKSAPPPPREEASNFVSGIPPIEQIKTIITPRSVELQWKSPSSDAYNFIIEQREIGMIKENGMPYFSWRGLPVKAEKQGNQVIAQLKNLRPGTILNIRIISEDMLGYLSQPSPTFRIEIPFAQKFRFPWWAVVLLFVGMGFYFYWKNARRKMRHLAEETERISRRI